MKETKKSDPNEATEKIEETKHGEDKKFLNSKSYAYHLATKHSVKSLYSSNHRLDWATQPDPFRVYEGSEKLELPREFYEHDFNVFEILRFDSIDQTCQTAPQATALPPQVVPADLKLISSILYYSMALSAWKQVVGTNNKWSLRVNPSSGNLHPTETHILVSNVAGISDGAYHYSVKDHTLEQRCAGKVTERIWHALELKDSEQPQIVIALTSIFWREAWKYRDRAFRYCQLDLGHAAAAISLASTAYGYRIKIVSEFADNLIAEALDLTDSDEKPMLLLCLYPDQQLKSDPKSELQPNSKLQIDSNSQSQPNSASQSNSGSQSNAELQSNAGSQSNSATKHLDSLIFKGRANALSSAEITYQSIIDVYETSCLTQEQYLQRHLAKTQIVNRRTSLFEAAELVTMAEKVVSLSDSAISLNSIPRALEIFRKRRSAVSMSPGFQTSLARMARILSASTRTDSGYLSKNADLEVPPFPFFIYPLLFVNKITGIAPGVYTLDRSRQTICLLEEGDVRANAKFVSCMQDIASDGVLAVSLIADLARAFELFG